MNSISQLFAALVAYVALTLSVSAATTTLWQIERLSDTEARISMRGTLGVPLPNNFEFIGASSIPGIVGTATPTGGDFMIGGTEMRLAFIRDNTFDLSLNVVGNAPVGATASGTLLVSLSHGAWADVGTLGDVRNTSLPGALTVGTFEIVAAVPLQASALLLLTGVAGAAALRRQRKKRVR